MRVWVVALAGLLLAASALGQAKPEAVFHKERGNEFLKSRDYTKARDEYLAALKVEPDYEDAHYNLGVVYFFRLPDYPRALYHLVAYARLRPEAQDLSQVRALIAQALEKIEESEREAYSKVLQEGTIEALRGYTQHYPQSPYVEDAKAKILLLENYETERLKRGESAQALYRDALVTGTPEAMDEFLRVYPDMPQAAEAARLSRLWAVRRAEDEAALEKALSAGTPEALRQFLDERPSSPLAPKAQSQLDRITASEQAFKIASGSRSIAALEVFLTTYQGTSHEAEARTLLEALRKEEAERKVKEEAEVNAKQKAELKAKQEAELRAKQEAELKAKQEAELKAKQEAELKAKQEAELKAKEEAERTLKEEAARKATEEAKTRAEADRAWDDARKANTADAFEAFRGRYPAHPMAGEAARRAAEMKPRPPPPPAPPPEPPPPPPAVPGNVLTAEDLLRLHWEEAQALDLQEAYEAFLSRYPNGDEADAARNRLQELQSEGAQDPSQLPGDRKKARDKYRKMIQGK